MDPTPTIANVAQNAQTQIQDATGSLLNAAESTWDEFADRAKVDPASLFGQETPTSDFLNTNGIIAKFVFVFFVTLGFLILFRIGLQIVTRTFTPPRDVILVDGIVSGNAHRRIKQNTINAANTPIYRSNNEPSGMEFTWGVWIYIEPTNGDIGAPYQHIFSKGDTVNDEGGLKTIDGILTPNNAPGLYATTRNGQSTLRVCMDDSTDKVSYVEMHNVPLRKWVHVAIRLKNMDLDIYVNGDIAGRKKMAAVPKQNYGDILVGYTNFNGSISNLAYYDSALEATRLANIVEKGPNMNSETALEAKASDYLSRLWYTDKW